MLIKSLFTTSSFQHNRKKICRGGNKAKIRFMNSSRPQNSVLMDFYELFGKKFIYRSLFCIAPLFCICWFIIFHLRTENFYVSMKIETQTQQFHCFALEKGSGGRYKGEFNQKRARGKSGWNESDLSENMFLKTFLVFLFLSSSIKCNFPRYIIIFFFNVDRNGGGEGRDAKWQTDVTWHWHVRFNFCC